MGEEEPEVMEEDPPKVELTAEEKALSFVKVTTPDLTQTTLNTSFGSFSVPEKDEGFDDVKFNWSDAAKSKALMKTYILDKKATTRVEDINPSAWFREKTAAWEKSETQWKKVVNDYKSALARKDAEKKKKEQAKIAKAKAAEAAKKKAEEAEKNGDKKDEKKEEESKPMEVEDSADEAEPVVVVKASELDVFEIDDVLDLGGGQPLTLSFGAPEWAMLNLRHDLHLLSHAFVKDVNDPDRAGIHADHLQFYYNRYFKKQLNPNQYGCKSIAEVLTLVRDTVHVGENNVLEGLLDAEMESLQIFVKLTEEDRRDRALRIDLGEEGARLKVQTNNWENNGNNGGNWGGNNWKQQNNWKRW